MELEETQKGHPSRGACAHSGNSPRDREFDPMCSTMAIPLFTCFFCPFAMIGDEWEGGGSIRAKIFRSSSHQLTSVPSPNGL